MSFGKYRWGMHYERACKKKEALSKISLWICGKTYVLVVHIYAKWVGQVLVEDCVNLFPFEHHFREGKAMPPAKLARIKHSFYPIPENSCGYVGDLRLIREGLWWSHRMQRNDSVIPAGHSQMLPAFGLCSKRQDAWPGLVVVVWASGSKDKQGRLFLKESEFLTCSSWKTAVQGRAEHRQALFLPCLLHRDQPKP